jgi:hypothetical protein
MPLTYARNTQKTPTNQHITLGYQDQVFNKSKDHLKELTDFKKEIEGTTERAQAPYVPVQQS